MLPQGLAGGGVGPGLRGLGRGAWGVGCVSWAICEELPPEPGSGPLLSACWVVGLARPRPLGKTLPSSWTSFHPGVDRAQAPLTDATPGSQGGLRTGGVCGG